MHELNHDSWPDDARRRRCCGLDCVLDMCRENLSEQPCCDAALDWRLEQRRARTDGDERAFVVNPREKPFPE